MHLSDRIRIEVAFVGGRELFGWPGVGRFEDKDLDALVGGTIGTGAFAGVPVQIFTSRLTKFAYKPGDETPADRKQRLRYEYEFPVIPNGSMVAVGSHRGVVGFHGSFWIERATSHLLRLELQADHIPQSVPLEDLRVNLDFQVIHLDERDYVVPRMADQTMVSMGGYTAHNLTTFTNCHQFRGESVIKFEDIDGEVHSSAPSKFVTLPEKLSVEAMVTNAVRSQEPAIGDAVQAEVTHDVKHDHQVVIPKGAKLTGRIARLRFTNSGTVPFYTVALLFHTVRWGDTEARIATETVALQPNARVGSMPLRGGISSYSRSGSNPGQDRLHDSTFYVSGRDFDLPRGTRLFLTTIKD